MRVREEIRIFAPGKYNINEKTPLEALKCLINVAKTRTRTREKLATTDHTSGKQAH